MKITNRQGLPESIVEAVRNDPYDRGLSDITVTELVGPPQIRRLVKQHWNELEEDCSERIWALFGQAVHAILERSDPGDIVEQRFYAWAGNPSVLVGGQVDRYCPHAKRVSDYKVTSVWAVVYGRPEWERQLNVLAWLMRQNGHEVRELETVAILRDWSRIKARYESGYPTGPVARIKRNLWSPEDQKKFVDIRLAMHQRTDVPCTAEDRWATDDVYALMKLGAKGQMPKRATRLFDSEAELLAWARENNYSINVPILANTNGKIPATIQVREAESKRCLDYCPVAEYCQQWRDIQREEQLKNAHPSARKKPVQAAQDPAKGGAGA